MPWADDDDDDERMRRFAGEARAADDEDVLVTVVTSSAQSPSSLSKADAEADVATLGARARLGMIELKNGRVGELAKRVTRQNGIC